MTEEQQTLRRLFDSAEALARRAKLLDPQEFKTMCVPVDFWADLAMAIGQARPFVEAWGKENSE